MTETAGAFPPGKYVITGAFWQDVDQEVLMMRIGIEQEFIFKDRSGRFLDVENTEYSLFEKIVDAFPAFAGDDACFECKSLERYPKRCYVEGFEIHGPDKKPVETLPKALEIRTLPHATVDAVVEEFQGSYALAMQIAEKFGLSPVLTSRHPFKSEVSVNRQYRPVESAARTEQELALAFGSMMTHGLQVNISMSGYSHEQMTDMAQKVNHYMPAFVPFSFSSPFYEGRVFEGLSYRGYLRAETSWLTELLNRQGVRILEFGGFDACGDARLLRALLTMFRGFLLDETLTGRSPSHDVERLKRASLVGYDDPSIKEQGRLVLNAAKAAIGEDAAAMDLLETMLRENDSYSARMKQSFSESGNIVACISNQYEY
jgi:hypothetical protein